MLVSCSRPAMSSPDCAGMRRATAAKTTAVKGSSIIVIIFTSVHSVRWGGGGQGRSYAFLNVVYSDGNEIIAHVRQTSMTKNPLVRNSLLVQKLVT